MLECEAYTCITVACNPFLYGSYNWNSVTCRIVTGVQTISAKIHWLKIILAPFWAMNYIVHTALRSHFSHRNSYYCPWPCTLSLIVAKGEWVALYILFLCVCVSVCVSVCVCVYLSVWVSVCLWVCGVCMCVWQKWAVLDLWCKTLTRLFPFSSHKCGTWCTIQSRLSYGSWEFAQETNAIASANCLIQCNLS